MSLLNAFKWRYAAKKYDAAKKLTSEQLTDLLETARLSPSSYGLQPYKLIVVNDPATRERLSQAAYGQPQILGGSHLVVLATETDVNEQSVARYIDAAAVARKAPREALAPREAQINAAIDKMSAEQRVEWGKRQTYLALGILISAAAAAGIDGSPMEGFDPAQVDEILGLRAQNLTSTVLMVLGFRAQDDEFATFAKVRKDEAAIIEQR
ncbi:NAD(P)H-dependent oxidoreductase [Hymenobacter daeguensis]